MVTSCADKTDNIKIEKKMEKTMTNATIKTNLGDIQLELNEEKAPITVKILRKLQNLDIMREQFFIEL